MKLFTVKNSNSDVRIELLCAKSCEEYFTTNKLIESTVIVDIKHIFRNFGNIENFIKYLSKEEDYKIMYM